MRESEIYFKQIEKIEFNGNFQEVWGVKTAKSFEAYIQSKINHFMKLGTTYAKEEEMKLRTILGVYKHFHPEIRKKIDLQGWKGKSTFEIFKKPDCYEVKTYQRPDQVSDYKPIIHIIRKSEFETLLKALGRLRYKEIAETKEIAKEYCILARITHNNQNKTLFEENGKFNFKTFFSDRSLHLKLNIMLRTLDKLEYISYRGGKTKILKELNVQTLFI